MTDVSAGALAAGTGALPGLAKPAGGPIGKSDFETELSAFADITTNGVPAPQDGTEFAGGDLPLVFAALFNPDEAGPAPAADGAVPEVAVPDGSVPAPAPAPAPGGNQSAAEAPLPTGAAAPSPRPFVPSAGQAAGQPAGQPETGLPDAPDLQDLPVLPDVLPSSASETARVPLPVVPPGVLPRGPEARPADTAVQPLPAQSSEAGRTAQAVSLPNAAAAPLQTVVPAPLAPLQTTVSTPAAPLQVTAPAPAASLKATAPSPAPAPLQSTAPATQPVPLKTEASPLPNAEVPDPAQATSRPVLAEPRQRPQGVIPLAPETQAASPLSNGRRWQSELPSELRAPVPAFQRTAEIVLPRQAPAVPVSAGDQVPVPAPAGSLAGPGAQTLGVPATGAANPIVLPENAAGVRQPFADDIADVPDLPPAARPANVATQSENASPTQVTGPAPQRAGAEPLTTQVANAPSAETAPDGFEPVSLRPEAGVKETKTPAPGGISETPASSSSPQTGASSAPATVESPADARPRSGPLAAAVPAAQLPLADPEGVIIPFELSATGDFTATIRGGETQGAVRTESLQAPSQAQSGQVATQVAAEIARNLKNGQTRFQMRFDPPELGRVDVNMRVGADGGVHAHLIVERPETLDMFLRDQRGLERALEAAGLSTNSENLQFSLRQDGGRDFASGEGGDDQAAQLTEDAGTPESDDMDPEAEAVIRLTLAESRGGLDVKI
ncbi:MAG: flagellar hook-length control protein FliK [Roseibium sp.]|uniref:flagellar hook-length control protein FliK n=1 Tax=Roseibium sp. TaxID=1936156 RepID=UPI003D9C2941